MDRNAIERFVRRDWEAGAASKRAYWAERFRQDGWRPIWDAAQSLPAHVRRVRADFPTDRDRALDLAHHEKLRDRLDRTAHAFARR